MYKKEKSYARVRPDVQVMKTSRWTFHSTPFLLLTFHHTTYHSGLLTMMMKITSLTMLMKITLLTMLTIEDHAVHSK